MTRTPVRKVNNGTILALDVGHVRIGVAIADNIARLPRPLLTLNVTDDVFGEIADLVDKEAAKAVIVGLPRGLAGQETAQTDSVRQFVKELKGNLDIPVHLQDEALTSKKAEQELLQRGKRFDKAAIDALAATYILEDYLSQHSEVLS